MEWHELLADAYRRVPEFLNSVLGGLTRNDLSWQPHPDCNSIGWQEAGTSLAIRE